jgi:hypothetical protein
MFRLRLSLGYHKIFKHDRQCTYNVTLRRVRELLLPWKSNEYYIFVYVCARAFVCPGALPCAHVHVALLIKHATHMCHIVMSFVASLSTHYFSTLSHKRHDFRKKKLLTMKRVLWYSQQILSKTFRDILP